MRIEHLQKFLVNLSICMYLSNIRNSNRAKKVRIHLSVGSYFFFYGGEVVSQVEYYLYCSLNAKSRSTSSLDTLDFIEP